MPASIPIYTQKPTIVENEGKLIVAANTQASLATTNASSDILVAV